MHYEAFLPYLLPAMRYFCQYIIAILLLFTCTPMHAQDDNLYTPVLKPADNPAEKFKQAVFLRVSASKNTVYTGEPVLVQYKLYISILTQPSPGKDPAFSGCSVVEMRPDETPVMETLNGKRYHVIIIRRVQLTPLQDGPLLLPEASVNNIIQYVTTDNTSLLKSFSMAAVSGALTLNVKPLPDTGRPAGFTGIIGSFTITARLDSNKVPANDNTHLTVVIKGAGNVGAINAPVVNWPANTEHFDGTDAQHTSQDSFPVSGDKVFTIPFIGKKQGDVTIPPVAFSYFDPNAEKYVTVYTDSLPVTFTGPLPKAEQKEIVTGDITNRKYLWIVPAIALTVAFVLIVSGQRQRRLKKALEAEKEKARLWEEVKQKAAMVKKPAFNVNAALRSLAEIEDDHAFFIKAKDVLTKALQQKFNTAATHETAILADMQLQKADAVVYENARHIYKICNLCLYSPVIEEGQRVLVHETLAVLVEELGM